MQLDLYIKTLEKIDIKIEQEIYVITFNEKNKKTKCTLALSLELAEFLYQCLKKDFK